MKIEQILLQPIGQRFNAGTLTIKTCKKTWQVKKVWYHQVKLTDGTDEIPADVKIGKYLPLKSGQEITLIIGAVRDGEYLGKPCKILSVEQYSIPTMTVDDWNTQEEDWHLQGQEQIKGKIRHGLTCALLTREHPDAVLDMKKSILELQDFIMTGE